MDTKANIYVDRDAKSEYDYYVGEDTYFIEGIQSDLNSCFGISKDRKYIKIVDTVDGSCKDNMTRDDLVLAANELLAMAELIED